MQVLFCKLQSQVSVVQSTVQSVALGQEGHWVQFLLSQVTASEGDIDIAAEARSNVIAKSKVFIGVAPFSVFSRTGRFR